MPAKARIVPDGFTPKQADVLCQRGLRQTGFNTILWSPLTMQTPAHDSFDIRMATTPEQIDAHISIQLETLPGDAIERLRPLRRKWWAVPQLRFSLAYIEDVPVAEAILDCRGEIAYLAQAGTLTAFRGKGLQTALIQPRLTDAKALGCQVVFAGADFESSSRTNQMACGLQVAYACAWWTQQK